MAKTTRSTARRVLRSDTAPARRLLELDNGDANADPANQEQNQQLETALEGVRRDMTALDDGLRTEVTASLTNVSDRISAEMLEIQGNLANLVQGMTNMVTTLNQTHPMAQTAQQMAVEVRDRAAQQSQPRQPSQVTEVATNVDIARPIEDINMTIPVETNEVTAMSVSATPRLRKMDVNPPIFDGLIDGIKLNSFLFQFESYFEQKGYNLQQHDHMLARELNQCVRKSALAWYERYMTDDMTVKLWSVIKIEMKREFREPNFDDKVRNQLLTIRQTGAYQGYVSKFRELQRVVRLDELTAVNLFVNGLTNGEMKRAIQRKQPVSLTALEKTTTSQQDNSGSGKQGRGGYHKQARGGGTGRPSQNQQTNSSRARKSATTLCSHCRRGIHHVDDCWVLHPEKKPRNMQQKQQLQQIHSMLETLMVGNEHSSSSTAIEPSN